MYSLPKLDSNIDYSKVPIKLSDVNGYSVL